MIKNKRITVYIRSRAYSKRLFMPCVCVGCFQRMSQPDISYEDLTKDYPRYPDIYDITTLHSVPEDALMVRLLYPVL